MCGRGRLARWYRLGGFGRIGGRRGCRLSGLGRRSGLSRLRRLGGRSLRRRQGERRRTVRQCRSRSGCRVGLGERTGLGNGASLDVTGARGLCGARRVFLTFQCTVGFNLHDRLIGDSEFGASSSVENGRKWNYDRLANPAIWGTYLTFKGQTT